MQIKICNFISQANEDFSFAFSEDKLLEEIREVLHQKKESEEIQFVYGKGQRKTTLQKAIETLKKFLTRQNKYEEYQNTFRKRNSFSKTDKDATFMHMKDDHMLNSQLKPRYNVQIGVEGEYIIGEDILDGRSDQLTLIPFLKRLETNFPDKKHENIVADAGYESDENYAYLDSTSQNSYIKPANYEKSKPVNIAMI